MNRIFMKLLDDGTTRALTWDAIYTDDYGFTLPAATVAGKTSYLAFVYNGDSTNWELISYVVEL
jgi:hypothetical protein